MPMPRIVRPPPPAIQMEERRKEEVVVKTEKSEMSQINKRSLQEDHDEV
jgi:hypothetical protein